MSLVSSCIWFLVAFGSDCLWLWMPLVSSCLWFWSCLVLLHLVLVVSGCLWFWLPLIPSFLWFLVASGSGLSSIQHIIVQSFQPFFQPISFSPFFFSNTTTIFPCTQVTLQPSFQLHQPLFFSLFFLIQIQFFPCIQTIKKLKSASSIF